MVEKGVSQAKLDALKADLEKDKLWVVSHEFIALLCNFAPRRAVTAQSEQEKEALLREKQKIDETKNALEEDVKRHQSRLESERQARLDLKKHLKDMEAKVRPPFCGS